MTTKDYGHDHYKTIVMTIKDFGHDHWDYSDDYWLPRTMVTVTKTIVMTTKDRTLVMTTKTIVMTTKDFGHDQ
jgi:hypothetical protein